jgi:hypothetical protein
VELRPAAGGERGGSVERLFPGLPARRRAGAKCADQLPPPEPEPLPQLLPPFAPPVPDLPLEPLLPVLVVAPVPAVLPVSAGTKVKSRKEVIAIACPIQTMPDGRATNTESQPFRKLCRGRNIDALMQ